MEPEEELWERARRSWLNITQATGLVVVTHAPGVSFRGTRFLRKGGWLRGGIKHEQEERDRVYICKGVYRLCNYAATSTRYKVGQLGGEEQRNLPSSSNLPLLTLMSTCTWTRSCLGRVHLRPERVHGLQRSSRLLDGFWCSLPASSLTF